MVYQLDTSVAISIRDGDTETLDRLASLEGPVAISVITRVELEGGIHRDLQESGSRQARLDIMLASIPVIPFEDRAAAVYRTIVQAVGFSRRKVSDRMIAAQALVSQATLITRNGADFRDIPGLILIEW